MIQIEDMTFAYGKSRHNIHTKLSLTLNENKIYGLLGKNGTGKSTLLYLIAGLLKPQGGSIKADGVKTIERRQETLEDFYIINEEFTLPPVKLSEWSTSLGGFYPKYDNETFRRCLNEFDITGDPILTSLSMGQQKKVIISFALATGVKHLLMDEPTNGLDIPSKSQFRKVIANNMTDDRILIISTHQVHDIESLLDHVLILSQSNLLLNASVSDISDDYKFEYRTPAEMDDSVLYAEPSLQGNAVIVRRQPSDHETPMNLELLFNAVITGKLR